MSIMRIKYHSLSPQPSVNVIVVVLTALPKPEAKLVALLE